MTVKMSMKMRNKNLHSIHAAKVGVGREKCNVRLAMLSTEWESKMLHPAILCPLCCYINIKTNALSDFLFRKRVGFYISRELMPSVTFKADFSDAFMYVTIVYLAPDSSSCAIFTAS